MGRECASCDQWLSNSNFSRNQWLKGDGYSRCKSCVGSQSYGQVTTVTYQCQECYRDFNSDNELQMHMQVHRPRNVACPVCGDRRFRSSANAVQHVESGYCTGCQGRDNARQQIYRFASNSGRMNQYLTETPLLTYGGNNYNNDVPDFPYKCPQCNVSFRQLSQLMQHQDNKHNNNRLMYY
jgi:DNA-directed RNA polymerase subunit RPC12/RpoP